MNREQRINKILKEVKKQEKQEKKRQKEYLKKSQFHFDFKKHFIKSLFILLSFILCLSILVPITTQEIAQEIKLAIWITYTVCFALVYIMYFIVVYKKERTEFLLADPYYVEENQAKSKYKKELKKLKLDCKLNNVKLTRKMKQDLKIECFTIYLDKSNSEKTKQFEEDYIQMPKIDKKEVKRQNVNIISDVNVTKENIDNSEIYIKTKFLSGKKQAKLSFDEATKKPQLVIEEVEEKLKDDDIKFFDKNNIASNDVEKDKETLNAKEKKRSKNNK